LDIDDKKKEALSISTTLFICGTGNKGGITRKKG
jgi:hypothetical protein